MKTSIKDFIEIHKTKIMIACAALVLVSASASYVATQMPSKHSMTVAEYYQMMQMQQAQGMNGQQMQMTPQQAQQYAQYYQQQQAQGYGQQVYGQQGGYYQQGQNANYGGYYGNGQQQQAYGGGYGTNYGGYSNGGGYATNGGGGDVDYTSGWYAQQAVQDKQAEKYDDYIRDQQNYSDGYGNTYKMESGYNQGWVDQSQGTYQMSNNAGYDPNVGSTSTYTEVTPDAE